MTDQEGLNPQSENTPGFAGAPIPPPPAAQPTVAPIPPPPAAQPAAAPIPPPPGAAPYAAPVPMPPAAEPYTAPAPAPPVAEPTTLPGGDTYRPSPAVVLPPGHGQSPVRPRVAPLFITLGISGVALLLAAIFVTLQLRPVKTVRFEQEPVTITPAAQPETSAPAPLEEPADEKRTYDAAPTEPTIEGAKAAFRKHSPRIYDLVQDPDTPTVKPTNQGLAFTWDYMDPTSSSAVEVHTFTVELDEHGKAVDFYGD